MNRIIVLLLIFALSFSTANSQESKFSVKWGEAQKESRLSTLAKVIPFSDDKTFVMRLQYKMFQFRPKMYLETLDRNLNKKMSYKIESKKNGKKLFYEGVHNFDGKVYLFTSFKDNKNKENEFYKQAINTKTGRPVNKVDQIAEIDYAGKAKMNAGNFDYELSEDESKILIYNNLPYEKNAEEQFGIRVYDNDFKLLWEKDVTLPYVEKFTSIQDYEVTNDGKVVVILKKFEEKVKFLKIRDYDMEILIFSEEENEPQKYPVAFEDYYLKELNVETNNNSEIIFAGFYSEKKQDQIGGSFFVKIDSKDGEIVSESFKEFDIDFVTDYFKKMKAKKTKKKKSKKKNVDLVNYDFRELVVREDGGAYLVAEQFYITTYTTTDSNGRTTTHYKYHYNNIAVVSIDAEGQIEWERKIPKRQVSTDDGGFYSSFSHHLKDDKLYFIYNEHAKNLVVEGGKIRNSYAFAFSPKKSIVVAYSFDKEGNKEIEELFNKKDSKTLVRPKTCFQLNEDEHLLFGQKGKKQKFGRLTIK